jgi:bifunctional DNA-binding transcriptional regulator/antitoxin component of YhaV-PrlF toxin-antitoxin module
VIPAAYRKALRLQRGDEVLLSLDEAGLHVLPAHLAVARAQALVRKYVDPRRRLAAELIAERRREAGRE